MTKFLLKSIVLILVLALSLGTLSGCGKQNAANTEAIVQAAVKAAMDAAEAPFSVTIAADGNYITIEDATGLSLQQLLAQAKITLGEDDILSVNTTQTIDSNITVEVLRFCHVTVTVVAKNPAQNVSYQTMLMGGTVADAIEAVGLTLAQDLYVNYALEDDITDNMEIIVFADSVTGIPTPQSVLTETTKATEPTKATEEVASEEEDTLPEKTNQKTSERYEVSRDFYYDCDGSGHGAIVITYSDGTQEEVYF